MDFIDYLWRTASAGDGAVMMAHALNTPAVRDGLLRRAALTNSWDELRCFAEAAGRVAERERWSRSGPETVVGICHWIVADRILRAVPAHDRAARLAAAALGSWSSPQRVAEAVAASPPLEAAAGAAFSEALASDRRAGIASEVLMDLDEAMDSEPERSDPDLVAFACNTPAVRDALLRDAARTGRWEDLAEAADAAADAACAAGTFDAGPRTVAAVARWMLGDPTGRLELESLRQIDRFADALLASGVAPLTAADAWAHAPRLSEDQAQAFDDQAHPPAELSVVAGRSSDPLLDAQLAAPVAQDVPSLARQRS